MRPCRSASNAQTYHLTPQARQAPPSGPPPSPVFARAEPSQRTPLFSALAMHARRSSPRLWQVLGYVRPDVVSYGAWTPAEPSAAAAAAADAADADHSAADAGRAFANPASASSSSSSAAAAAAADGSPSLPVAAEQVAPATGPADVGPVPAPVPAGRFQCPQCGERFQRWRACLKHVRAARHVRHELIPHVRDRETKETWIDR